jgi:predicted phosphoribosyltransferase
MGDGTVYLDDRIVGALEISEEYVEKEKYFQIEEIKRRSALYRNGELKQSLDRTVILVDDGAASGATVIAAARSIKSSNTRNLIIGLPVAPKETVELLKKEADHVEVVTTPSSFFNSLGQYYRSFESVPDEKVREIMKKRNLLL